MVVGREAEHERVGLGGRIPHEVELRGVPQGLVGDLRHAHGVRGWARPGGLEGLVGRVVHVSLVVWAIEVLAVPAGGKWSTVMTPPLHWPVGKSASSGKRVPLSSRHTKRRLTCSFAASRMSVTTLPTVMWKP